MNVLTRFLSLARADAHGVVDALEDEALVLRQQLREAWSEISRKRARLDVLSEERDSLLAEVERSGERKAALDEDVQLALANDKDDLARFAVRQVLGIDLREKQIEQRLRSLEREYEPLQEKLEEQQVEYQSLEQRVRCRLAVLDREPAERGREPETFVRDEEVELELIRRRARHGADATGGEA